MYTRLSITVKITLPFSGPMTMILMKMITTEMILPTSSEPFVKFEFYRMQTEISFDQRPENEEKKRVQPARQCPYLDTINRHVLDFDFEKVIPIIHDITIFSFSDNFSTGLQCFKFTPQCLCLFGLWEVFSRSGARITCILSCTGVQSPRVYEA